MIETILALFFAFLSFLIVYGILNKIRIFEKSINIVISIVVSFFVIFTFYSYNYFILNFLSFFILLLLLIFILLSFYFYKKRFLNEKI